MIMTEQFKSIKIQISESKQIGCEFEEHIEESILWIRLSGTCSVGSQGEDYGQYLYQKIGLSLSIVQPLAMLIHLRDLHYEFGERILELFAIFSDLKIFDKDKILTAFLLSDKNKYGLTSLLQFDIEKPKSPIFYDIENAYQYLFQEYDKI